LQKYKDKKLIDNRR